MVVGGELGLIIMVYGCLVCMIGLVGFLFGLL
jgi:hypothetical protein